MIQWEKTNQSNRLVKAVFALGIALVLPACASQPIWQGQDVLVEARHEALAENVDYVSEDHRELKDRFDALERLYVELVQHVKAQESQLQAMNANVASVQKDPQVLASVNRVRNDVATIRDQLKKLENRMFSVEMADGSPAYQDNAIVTAASAEASADDTSVSATVASAPAANIKASDEALLGVHLASYRSKEQVNSGWANIERSFAADLNGLTPLVYTQSQEGIGSFMRLVAGPLLNEQEAEALCGRLKQVNPDQYCRIAEYQGEPIG